jgi:hypothetical protein
MSRDVNGLSWLELIAVNPNVEKLFNERKIGLKNLHKLPEVTFLHKNLSKYQLAMILDDVYDKASDVLSRRGKADGTNNLGDMMLHGVSRVGEYQRTVPFVTITRTYQNAGGLLLTELSHNAEHKRDEGDYGCHGYFDILTCSLNGVQMFQYTHSCDCHKDDVGFHDGKIVKYDYAQGDSFYAVKVLKNELYGRAITALNNLNSRSEKKDKLDQVISQTGMSKRELKKLLGE